MDCAMVCPGPTWPCSQKPTSQSEAGIAVLVMTTDAAVARCLQNESVNSVMLEPTNQCPM